MFYVDAGSPLFQQASFLYEKFLRNLSYTTYIKL